MLEARIAVAPNELTVIRRQTVRWKIVDRLAKRLEAIVRANTGIDALTEHGWHAHAALREAADREKELSYLQVEIESEINRLTAELLRAELKEKKRKDAK